VTRSAPVGVTSSVRSQPLEAEDRADDVDDRVERAHLVQVDLLDRRGVDRGLGLGETMEQALRALLSPGRQRGSIDRPFDLGERMMVPVIVPVRGRIVMVMRVRGGLLRVDAELRCGHAGTEHTFARHVSAINREAAERPSQLVDRQSEVEQRADRHIARGAGEAVQIQRLRQPYKYPFSRKLQYRWSARMT
jgi:hypothetical protein